jgi:hypothetical protein
VRTRLVTIEQPPVSALSNFGQILELLQAARFVPIVPLKSDVRILILLAGLDTENDHPVELIPRHKFTVKKLRADIRSNQIRKATFQI